MTLAWPLSPCEKMALTSNAGTGMKTAWLIDLPAVAVLVNWVFVAMTVPWKMFWNDGDEILLLIAQKVLLDKESFEKQSDIAPAALVPGLAQWNHILQVHIFLELTKRS